MWCLRFAPFCQVFSDRIRQQLWSDHHLLTPWFDKERLLNFLSNIQARIFLMMYMSLLLEITTCRSCVSRCLEVIPFIGHVWCVQKTWGHCFGLLYRLCVTSCYHFFIQDKNLFDRVGFRGSFFKFFFFSLRILGLVFIVETVFEPIDFFFEFFFDFLTGFSF